jgi:DNA gyrase subunit A
LVGLLPIDSKENITAILAVDHFTPDRFLVMATARGEVKKASLSAFSSVRSNGIIATGLKRGDELVSAVIVHEGDDVILVSRNGQAVRFCTDILRLASRTSGGVRGMRLSTDDSLASMDVVILGSHLLTVSVKGFGKLTQNQRFPRHGRGGLGVKAHLITSKTGAVAAAKIVSSDQELMVMSAAGVVLRTTMGEIRIVGRSAQGVSLMKPGSGDKVISITSVDRPGAGVDEAKDDPSSPAPSAKP